MKNEIYTTSNCACELKNLLHKSQVRVTILLGVGFASTTGGGTGAGVASLTTGADVVQSPKH